MDIITEKFLSEEQGYFNVIGEVKEHIEKTPRQSMNLNRAKVFLQKAMGLLGNDIEDLRAMKTYEEC